MGRQDAALLLFVACRRIAPREHDAGNQHLVADFQRADFFFDEPSGFPV